MMTWRELIVTDSDGATWADNLGKLVETAPANLDSATIENDKIVAWDGLLLSAPGEEPNYDTPSVPVDWTGLEDALKVARS
jgi:hypothetical protein